MKNYYNILVIIYLITFFAVPRLNIKILGSNLYFIDILSIFLILNFINFKNNYNFSKAVKFILFIFIIHQLVYLFVTGELLVVTYMTIRYSIPILAFYYIFPIILETYKSKPSIVINSIKFPILFSSLTSILYSIPLTRTLVSGLYSINYLIPTGELTVANDAFAENAVRTYSLLGISNLSSLIILFGLGLVIFFEKNKILNIKDYLIRIIIIIGVLTSYSRTIFLALIILILVTFFYSRVKNIYKLSIISFLLAIVLSWSFLISDTKYLNFKRIDSTVFNIDDGNTTIFDISLAERYNSYIDPFNDLMENPTYFFIGSTINKLKIKRTTIFNTIQNPADHSLFGRTFYIHGLFVCYLYIFILFTIFKETLISILRYEYIYFFSIPVMIWCMTTHGAISNTQGSVVFFLTLFITLNYKKIN